MNHKKNMSLKSSNVILIPITMLSTVNIFDKINSKFINHILKIYIHTCLKGYKLLSIKDLPYDHDHDGSNSIGNVPLPKLIGSV
jgi:hypothetical protein